MRLIALAAVLAISLGVPAAEPVAFVADLRGNASIEGNGPLVFLAELAEGSRLNLGSGATVAVTYAATGAEFTARGPGEYLVGAAEVEAVRGPAPTRRTVTSLSGPGIVSRVAHTATASLRMRGAPPPVAVARSSLQYPVDTRVSSLQPMLRFRGDPSQEGFTISLVDADGREVWKGRAQPDSTRPGVRLTPGARYKWTVIGPAGLLGEATFETLAEEKLASLERSRGRARSFSERVVHAILLQDLGASQEARDAWAALARERPDLPGLTALAR